MKALLFFIIFNIIHFAIGCYFSCYQIAFNCLSNEKCTNFIFLNKNPKLLYQNYLNKMYPIIISHFMHKCDNLSTFGILDKSHLSNLSCNNKHI